MQILWFQKLRYGKTHPAESETCATGCNFARDHAGIEHCGAPKSSPVASEPALFFLGDALQFVDRSGHFEQLCQIFDNFGEPGQVSRLARRFWGHLSSA